MRASSLKRLSDPAIVRGLTDLVADDRTTTARLLAYLGEADARRLYLPAAQPSMFSYCLQVLRMSEDVAFKRIRAARVARRFPGVLAMLADGRLHLAGVVLLAPHLVRENAEELLAAASGRTRAEIERLLAERFPRPDLPERLEAIRPASGSGQLSAGTVVAGAFDGAQLAPGPVGTQEAGGLRLAPGPVAPATPPPKVMPLAPERYALQLTVDQGTHDKLRHAQALLGHQVPSGDLAEVLDRVLDLALRQLERRKCGASERPGRPARRRSANPRHIPARVRRTVWARDGGRCTFVSPDGQRCPARARLEFDHADPVSRGGQPTPDRLRLRCRAHNQFTAERLYGHEFMAHKRREAKRVAEQRARERAEVGERERESQNDVIPWLRRLGVSPSEARRAVEQSQAGPGAPLPERVRLALRRLGPPRHRSGPRLSNAI